MDLDALIDRFRGPLVGLLASWGNDRGKAVDLAQDVFAEAWCGRANFRGAWTEDAAVGPWLRGIARNLHRRSRRLAHGPGSRPLATSLDDVPDDRLVARAEAVARDEHEAVRLAVARLRQPYRTVLTMRYVEASGLDEIAAVLGTSVRAVEGRLRRARHELKALLPGNRPSPLAKEEGR